MDMPTILGLNLKTVVIILMISVVLLLILLIIMMNKMSIISRKYEALMSGKKGADLEKVIRIRFKEMDKVKANAKRVTKEHKEIKKHLDSCISKYGLVKYDAFNEMAGNLSFAIALLNEKNSGIVINSMHSREGCYTYAKEIIEGESFIPLSEEEKEAINRAKTIDEEIKEMTEYDDPDLEFDIQE